MIKNEVSAETDTSLAPTLMLTLIIGETSARPHLTWPRNREGSRRFSQGYEGNRGENGEDQGRKRVSRSESSFSEGIIMQSYNLTLTLTLTLTLNA